MFTPQLCPESKHTLPRFPIEHLQTALSFESLKGESLCACVLAVRQILQFLLNHEESQQYIYKVRLHAWFVVYPTLLVALFVRFLLEKKL